MEPPGKELVLEEEGTEHKQWPGNQALLQQGRRNSEHGLACCSHRLWVQLSSHRTSFSYLWRAYRDGKSCFKLIRGGHLGTSFGTGFESKTHDGGEWLSPPPRGGTPHALGSGASSTSAVAGTAVPSKRRRGQCPGRGLGVGQGEPRGG